MKQVPADQGLEEAAKVIREGGLICYPTETYYALGCDPWNQSACEKIFQIKGREASKELPLIAADAGMVGTICDTSDLRFEKLSARFWPGPLTLVLRSLDEKRTYAVRVSSHPVARELSRLAGVPIVSTSANHGGLRPADDPAQLESTLLVDVAILLDGGRCAGGKPSTIVSIAGKKTHVLREGAIPSADVLSAL